jgi:hypothetical protein
MNETPRFMGVGLSTGRARVTAFLGGEVFLSRYGAFLPAAAILPFLMFNLLAASVRPLWYDELYTYNIANLPSLAQIWHALSSGEEQLPFFYYVMEWNVVKLFGASEFTLRLPSFIGFLVGLLSIFLFLRKTLGPFYAGIGAIAPAGTGYQAYLVEARPYGLVLGFAGIALCAWNEKDHPTRRKAALVCLSCALTLLPSLHYFAVLVVVPLMAAEIVRAYSKRSLDLVALTVMICAPAAGLLLNAPLMLSAAGTIGNFWSPGGSLGAGIFVIGNNFRQAWTLLSISFVVPLAIRAYMIGPIESVKPQGRLSSAQWTAALCLLLLPLLGVLTAKVVGAFVDRYFIPMVLGCGIVTAALLAALFRSLSGKGASVAAVSLVLAAFLGLEGWATLKEAKAGRSALYSEIQMLRSYPSATLPIVTNDNQTFVALNHYAPTDIRLRLVYLVDQDLAIRWLGYSQIEKAMYKLVEPWFHANVINYQNFISKNSQFLLFGRLEDGWLDRQLRSEGWIENVRGIMPGGQIKYLLEVHQSI